MSSYDKQKSGNRGNGGFTFNTGKFGPNEAKAKDVPPIMTKQPLQAGSVWRSASPQEQQQHEAAKRQPDDNQSSESNTDAECETGRNNPDDNDGDKPAVKLPGRIDGRDAADDVEAEKKRALQEVTKGR